MFHRYVGKAKEDYEKICIKRDLYLLKYFQIISKSFMYISEIETLNSSRPIIFY